ncbi:MAG TPA: hypothetical protein VF865_14930 [Acidobacteriaceae bacterium]
MLLAVFTTVYAGGSVVGLAMSITGVITVTGSMDLARARVREEFSGYPALAGKIFPFFSAKTCPGSRIT